MVRWFSSNCSQELDPVAVFSFHMTQAHVCRFVLFLTAHSNTHTHSLSDTHANTWLHRYRVRLTQSFFFSSLQLNEWRTSLKRESTRGSVLPRSVFLFFCFFCFNEEADSIFPQAGCCYCSNSPSSLTDSCTLPVWCGSLLLLRPRLRCP